jgi:hypothetical protein
MRIQEELMVLQKGSTIGAPRERLDGMLKLNRETTEAIRRSLVIAESDLRRAEAE